MSGALQDVGLNASKAWSMMIYDDPPNGEMTFKCTYVVPCKKKVATSKNGSKQIYLQVFVVVVRFVFILIISIFTFCRLRVVG